MRIRADQLLRKITARVERAGRHPREVAPTTYGAFAAQPANQLGLYRLYRKITQADMAVGTWRDWATIYAECTVDEDVASAAVVDDQIVPITVSPGLPVEQAALIMMGAIFVEISRVGGLDHQRLSAEHELVLADGAETGLLHTLLARVDDRRSALVHMMARHPGFEQLQHMPEDQLMTSAFAAYVADREAHGDAESANVARRVMSGEAIVEAEITVYASTAGELARRVMSLYQQQGKTWSGVTRRTYRALLAQWSPEDVHGDHVIELGMRVLVKEALEGNDFDRAVDVVGYVMNPDARMDAYRTIIDALQNVIDEHRSVTEGLANTPAPRAFLALRVVLCNRLSETDPGDYATLIDESYAQTIAEDYLDRLLNCVFDDEDDWSE